MLARTSKVDSLKVSSTDLASVIQIGDSNRIIGFTRAIAVQRQREIFYANEGNFYSFPIFSYNLPLPPVNETVSIRINSLKPLIHVKDLNILAISSSSFLHIGSSEQVQLESRILHIRQIETVEEAEAL